MLVEKYKHNFSYLFFILFAVLSLSSLPTKDEVSGSTNMQYLLITLFILIAICSKGLKRRLHKSLSYNFIDLIPILIFIVWLYGVFVGLINNVDNAYVFRNFGGMGFYLTFYAFYLIKLNIKTIIKSVFITAYLGIPLIFYLTYLALTGGDVSNVGGERVIFCFLQLIIFIPFVVIFGNFFFPINENKKYYIFRNKLSVVLIFVITYITSVIISFSKGMILASLAIMAMIIILRFFKGFKLGDVLKILAVIIVFIGILVSFDLLSLLEELFSNREVSNATRSLQYTYLIDDLNFFGHGLGAGLSNINYVRAENAPYAFELTYINLIHKFGFLSIILFFIYIYTFWKIFQLFGNNPKKNFIGLICIGLMAYVFPSIGNPFLLSPLGVMCHILTLYIIKVSNSKKLNEIYGEASL